MIRNVHFVKLRGKWLGCFSPTGRDFVFDSVMSTEPRSLPRWGCRSHHSGLCST